MKVFASKIAVVTGGASGIGRACAELLARQGARVVVADRNAQGAAEVASQIGGEAYELDISDAQSIEWVANSIETDVGPVQLFVANAGIIQKKLYPPEQLTLEEWDDIFSVDLRGTYQCCTTFGSSMARAGAGSIVTIASIAGIRSAPNHAYSVAKAGVIHMTSNLAVEWGRSGVRVNSVSPGFTRTPMLEHAFAQKLRNESVMSGKSALGRLVLPEEIAATVSFLLSDQASAITGVNLPVDAGWLAASSWHSWDGVPDARAIC